ncbi:transposase [Enterococcus faecalis]|uniref:Transposase DDE domain-containing protein n=2 Tax=Enterococcus faecalis TaxID=1351 RepID=A0A8B3RSA2_ENTFL|nr:transposase [Enterococcus faecalis]EGO2699347.1 transposase [Enterococcus faecalis]EGO2735746.1 transposase [Enterococcus faecalis]EGO2809743.1 transposase [Enterococcus faecalis]EGO5041868.1 transposase [Enterococcus faecalis]EGO5115582.1 transposase [Enterococcus faecalis]
MLQIQMESNFGKGLARLLRIVAHNGQDNKRPYYYGFKISLSVDSKGIPVTYEVTSASIHNVNITYDLVKQAPNKQILADKGHIVSKSLSNSYPFLVY